MPDVQNIPAPDSGTSENNDDFGSHGAIEQDLDNEDVESIYDAEDIPKERDPETGIEQLPEDDNTTGVEQPPNVAPH